MPKQSTVVIVNHNAGSPHHGPNLRSYYTAKHLVRRGYAVTIISSSFSHKYVSLPKVSGSVTAEEIDGIQYFWVRTHRYRNVLGRILSFAQFGAHIPAVIKENLSEVHAIICSSPPPVFARICRRLAQEHSARFIFDVRDLWPLAIIEMGSASRYNPYVLYLSQLERYAYRNADVVVSALPCAESYMRSRGLPEGHFFCIENGTDVTPTASSSSEPARLPLSVTTTLNRRSRFRVGYAGAFDRDNDLESLLGAAEILRDRPIEFVLVGQGQARIHLEARAAHLPNVHILPAVPSYQVPAILEQFDVCYMGLRDKPINQYGISMNKIFEYLNSGRPIVSAINAGNDIVTAAECGVTISPEEPEALAAEFVRFSEMDAGELQAFGDRGAAYLRTHHSYEVLVERWITAIEGTC